MMSRQLAFRKHHSISCVLSADLRLVDGINNRAPQRCFSNCLDNILTNNCGAFTVVDRGEIMKRHLRSSSYLTDEDDVLFDDAIVIDVDITWPGSAVTSSEKIYSQRFPGIEKFKEDVLYILENDYHFEVVEDVYNGKRQKGYITNREDSISIYFDTYFDLANAGDAIQRLGITNLDVPNSGKVFCFIYLRFSDHELNDSGDVAHNAFTSNNAKKYIVLRDNVGYFVPEENIVLEEKSLYRAYTNTLEDLKDELDFRIASWVKRFTKKNRTQP